MQMPKRFGYAVATICVGCCIWTAGADGVQAVDAVHALSSRRHQGIPSVAISPANGRRWCVWYASKTGDEDSNNYLIVATAPGDGPSWREVLVIDPDGEGPRRAFDPEIWFSPDGLLRIFWTERMAPLAANTTAKGSGCLADPKNDELWMLTLNGECEPDVAELALPRKIARGVMMCKPIVLKDGSWALPISNWTEAPSSVLWISRNGGQTFEKRGGAILPERERLFDEQNVIERKDGVLEFWTRTRQMGIWVSQSRDGGETWSDYVPRMNHTSSRFSLSRLNSGSLLLVRNGPVDADVGRSRMSAFVSDDDGKTWTGGLLLDERSGVSYPDGVETADGRICVVYDRDRTESGDVLCATFTENDVRSCCNASGSCRFREVVSSFTQKTINSVENPLRKAGVRKIEQPRCLFRGTTGINAKYPFDAAAWIWGEEKMIPPDGEFLRFRRSFAADGKTPLRFYVSADEQYVLSLDGEAVARGPDRGSVDMWFVDGYEVVPTAGEHVLEAVCWRLNRTQRPNAQLSWSGMYIFKTLGVGGFLFKAEGVYDEVLSTGKAKWTVENVRSVKMTTPCSPTDATGAQCEVVGSGLFDRRGATGCCEARVVRSPVPEDGGSRRVHGWIAYPTELPARVSYPTRPGRFVAGRNTPEAENVRFMEEDGRFAFVENANRVLKGKSPLVIPPHVKINLLWDLENYHCAFPILKTTGGKGAAVKWGWAESLYVGNEKAWETILTNGERKGTLNRGEWRGKYFYGKTDTFVSDGRSDACFDVPWWRCGRWCQLEIDTKDHPLTVTEVGIVETRYPFEPLGAFRSNDESLSSIRDLCVRGSQMCMHDMFFDCPYYEQQMYPGDARVQMLITSALSRDPNLIRQSFRQFEVTQRENGIVSMCAPTKWLVESATYTFLWGMMLGDYLLWHGDGEWVRARMPSVRKWLFSVECHLDQDGLLRELPGWQFVDWVNEWEGGSAPGRAPVNLSYVLALENAVRVEDALGERELAARWRHRRDMVKSAIMKKYWDEKRGMIADDATHEHYSEHSQCLAILGDLVDGEQGRRIEQALASPAGLSQCSAYFSHYLFGAYFKMRRPDLFLSRLSVWRDMVSMGLKTPQEGPGDTRSDCHAWSSHPLYHFQTGIGGICPVAPGCDRVRVAPQPGNLKWIDCKVPIPQGWVMEVLEFKDGKPTGIITLPEGVEGEFIWDGRKVVLKTGVNCL